MSGELHPLAPHTLPPFIGAADGSDPLFSAIIFIVILALLKLPDFLTPINSISESLKKLTPEEADAPTAIEQSEEKQ